MKLLHTSDWHLGRRLFGRDRHHEHKAFLDWLLETISGEHVDVLLVAGDIFDTTTPANKTLRLYYDFLCRVASSCCRHMVLTAGNHDSPSLLAAPKELLAHLKVHVVASSSTDGSDELLLLDDENGTPQLIVCAVPYLRDRDIRKSEAGESMDDKQNKLIEGISRHYKMICDQALQLRHKHGDVLPIVAMGHLFTSGARVTDGDGVRELYVGNLAHVQAADFPDVIDYMALGHLHSPQVVGGDPTRRYSGAPLPMGFGEADQEKSILLVDCSQQPPSVSDMVIPIFQRLASIQGDLPKIFQQLEELKQQEQSVLLEVVYQGTELIADLQQQLEEVVADSQLILLRCLNQRRVERSLALFEKGEELDLLTESEVFDRCLQSHDIQDEQQDELRGCFREILTEVHEDENS